MILPLRIKGEEYTLMKGDFVVCVTEHFKDFTYGRQYKLFNHPLSSLLPIKSDNGLNSLPSYYSPNGYYFLPIYIWRELKINKILESE